MTEREFQTQVVTLARFYGWRVFHPLPGMTRTGRWTTPTEGDTGYPDLTLVKAGPRGGVIFAELKTEKGRVSQAQTEWLDELRGAGAEAYLWRPDDLETITERLAARTTPANPYRDAAALTEDLIDARETLNDYRQRVHHLNEALLNANAERDSLAAQLRTALADVHYLSGDHLGPGAR